MVRTGRGLAPRLWLRAPPRKRAGEEENEMAPRRSQSSYLALVESFKISQVKHLQGLLAPPTGRFPARPGQ